MVNKIFNNNLDEARNSKFAILDFSAKWCAPCKMLAPIFDELSEEMSGQVDFFNIDADENSELSIEFGIRSIPALIILKNGQRVAQEIGFQSKESLKNFIEQHI